ncbi:MAG: thioesterase family protein [Pseudomonadota bacterium]
MKLISILQDHEIQGDGAVYPLPETWQQGRTAYGGLTAAIAAAEAERRFGSLPPLRSAQIAFVGPATGSVKVTSEVLRQGRSTIFVQSTLRGEEGVTTQVLLVYGKARASALQLENLPMPEVKQPDDIPQSFQPPPGLTFLNQFDLCPADASMPFAGAGRDEVVWWARHRDPAAQTSLLGVLALGDVLPPAAAMRMQKMSPLSSATWHTDFLTDDVSGGDGWFLMRSIAERAADGWSAQTMAMWSRDGQPVLAGRQNVAVFG